MNPRYLFKPILFLLFLLATASNVQANTYYVSETSGSDSIVTLGSTAPTPILSVTPSTALTSAGLPSGPFTPSSVTYSIANIGDAPMNWAVSNTSSWLTVSPASGTLAAGGSTTATATLTSNANSLTSGTYSDSLEFANMTSGTGNTSIACTLTVGTDYFTQLFNSGSNNTAYHSFSFTPNGTGGYSNATCDAIASFPTNPTGGTKLAEGDDSSVAVTLTGSASVKLYGTAYTTFYVGSNGYITFGSSDTTYDTSLDAHFSIPRISGLFRDLNPGISGTVSWKQLTDRVAVTYQKVPAYNSTNYNNFQIEMFFDGRIRITVLSIQSLDGLIGLSQGLGIPSDFTNSNFIGYPSSPPSSPPSLSVTTADNTTTNQSSITIQGSASSANGISSVTVNGVAATTSDGFSHWSATVGSLSPGINTMTVIATDSAFLPNTTSASRHILYYTNNSSLFGDGLPDAWKIAHGLDPFSNAGGNSATGNPSGDGISNLMKYALNLDPQLKQAGKLPYTTKAVNIADSKTYLIFNYRRIIGGGGLNYIVESSTNLTSWTSSANDLTEISSVPDADGVTEDVQVRVSPSLNTPSAGSKFIRLRIIVSNGPLVINTGGTYSGNWTSTDPNTPAVTIATSSPVTILNSYITGPGDLISGSNVRNYDVTVKNCYGNGVNPNVNNLVKGYFVKLPHVINLDVENCQVQSTGGGVLFDQYSNPAGASNTVKIKCNRFINMDARYSNGTGGYQATGHIAYHTILISNANTSNNPVVEIAWNEMINMPWMSAGEDVINIHAACGTSSSHMLIHDNYIYGAWPTNPLTEVYSGGGIITDGWSTDTAATATAFLEVYNNQIVATDHYGLGILSGHDNNFHDNRVIASGKLQDGTWAYGSNVGLQGYNSSNQPGSVYFNNSMSNILVGWMTSSGRNDWFCPAVTLSNITQWTSGGPTLQDEANEYQLWLQKLQTSGTTVGPISAP